MEFQLVRYSDVIFALIKLHVKSFEVFLNARITKYLMIRIPLTGYSIDCWFLFGGGRKGERGDVRDK